MSSKEYGTFLPLKVVQEYRAWWGYQDKTKTKEIMTLEEWVKKHWKPTLRGDSQ